MRVAVKMDCGRGALTFLLWVVEKVGAEKGERARGEFGSAKLRGV